MNRETGEFGSRSGMAFFASNREIGLVDGGAWIRGRQDQMRTVATGAVRNHRGPKLGRQTVVAVQVTADPGGRNAEFAA